MKNIENYTIERVYSFDDIDQNEWNDVLEKSTVKTIFQTYEWNRLVYEYTDHELVLLRVRLKDSDVVAFAPLCQKIQDDKKIIQLISAVRGDYADFILHNEHELVSIKLIFEYVFDNFPDLFKLELEKIPHNSPLLSIAQKISQRTIIADGATCPSLVFQNETFKTVSKKLNNKKMRYYKRRIMSMGDYVVEHHTDFEAIEPYLKNFYNQYAARWKNTPWPSRFLNKKECEFFNKMIKKLTINNHIIFSVIKLGEEFLGFHIGFSFKDRFIWYKPTYNIEYSKYSPGLVLMKECIDFAMSNNCTEFDFAAGNESYKGRFSNVVNKNHNISVYSNRIDWYKSRVRLVYNQLKQKIKSVLKISK